MKIKSLKCLNYDPDNYSWTSCELPLTPTKEILYNTFGTPNLQVQPTSFLYLGWEFYHNNSLYVILENITYYFYALYPRYALYPQIDFDKNILNQLNQNFINWLKQEINACLK